MQHIPYTGERRLGNRRPPAGSKLLAWGRPAEPAMTWGWLRDVSPGGIGFTTDRAGPPAVGEEIELLPVRGHNRLLCRVVRVAEQGLDESLVIGCRIASGGPAPDACASDIGPLLTAATAFRNVRFTGDRAAARHRAEAGFGPGEWISEEAA